MKTCRKRQRSASCESSIEGEEEREMSRNSSSVFIERRETIPHAIETKYETGMQKLC